MVLKSYGAAVRRRLLTPYICYGLFIVALLGILLGWVTPGYSSSQLSPAPVAEPTVAAPDWSPTGFAAPMPTAPFLSLHPRGSWISTNGNADQFTGETWTGWYKKVERPVVFVCGYPAATGNLVEIETRDIDGNPLPPARCMINPGEAWKAWYPSLPTCAAFLRLHAVDGLTGFQGWLGFTEPGSLPLSGTLSWPTLIQTFGAVALALILVLGPGLLYRTWRGGAWYSVLWPGPLVLAFGGLVCWCIGSLVPPSTVALVWVGSMLLLLYVGTIYLQPWRQWTKAEHLTLALIALAVFGAASRAAFSGGPPGELYSGRVSRTLEVGAHSDSRISFHNVQLIANHLAPYSPEGQKYYTPDTFSHRGPLAGLVAAPVVLATGGKPPREMPDQLWQPFDPQGFATFRIVVATLSACALLSAAGLLSLVRGSDSAITGVGLLSLSPFFWHELYFSWPKMAAASWVIGGFTLILQGRAFAAGLAFGGAYLFHPVALLSLPFAGLWCLRPKQPWRSRIRQSANFALGAGVTGIAWFAVNHDHFRQNGFFNYFIMADGGFATWQTWWLSRWQSLANTFLPGYVWLFHSDHESFNAIGAKSGGWVHFSLQAWTALPFAIGLVAWATLLPVFMRSLLRHRAVAVITLIAPTLLILIYWGAAITGIMRQCGHVLFLSGWIFLVWAATEKLPKWSRSPPFVIARTIEVLAVVLGPTLATGGAAWPEEWLLNDILWLTFTIVAVAAVGATVARNSPGAA